MERFTRITDSPPASAPPRVSDTLEIVAIAALPFCSKTRLKSAMPIGALAPTSDQTPSLNVISIKSLLASKTAPDIAGVKPSVTSIHEVCVLPTGTAALSLMTPLPANCIWAVSPVPTVAASETRSTSSLGVLVVIPMPAAFAPVEAKFRKRKSEPAAVASLTASEKITSTSDEVTVLAERTAGPALSVDGKLLI